MQVRAGRTNVVLSPDWSGIPVKDTDPDLAPDRSSDWKDRPDETEPNKFLSDAATSSLVQTDRLMDLARQFRSYVFMVTSLTLSWTGQRVPGCNRFCRENRAPSLLLPHPA